jgi:hypothetical protein
MPLAIRCRQVRDRLDEEQISGGALPRLNVRVWPTVSRCRLIPGVDPNRSLVSVRFAAPKPVIVRRCCRPFRRRGLGQQEKERAEGAGDVRVWESVLD